MYAFDLQAKLARLNPRLFLDITKRTRVRDEVFSVGVYEKMGQRQKQTKNTQVLSNDAQRYIEQVDSGQYNYIAGVAYPYVPEYDVFDLTDNQLIMRGWRSLLTHLASRKLIDIKKARRLFGCNELGLSQYDKASYEGKLAWARKDNR